MSELSRASAVLEAVLERLPSKLAPDLHLYDSWTEGDTTICIVYASSLTDGMTGLRREIEEDLPVQVVADDVVVCDLGEPLGAQADGLSRDERGILWWPGIPAEWRYHARKAREGS